MKIVHGNPPNIAEIKAHLSPSPIAVFCYGDTIYNPSGRDLAPDIEYHESIHSRQQGAHPDAWWLRYLIDSAFRLEQETEAYGEQYAFAKKHIEAAAFNASLQGKHLAAGKNNLLQYALKSMATALSGQSYGNLLSYGEAESAIRNYAKQTA